MASRKIQKPPRKARPGSLAPELQFTLHLSEGQLGVLEKALDLYARVGMGQLAEVMRVMAEGRENTPGIADVRDALITAVGSVEFPDQSQGIRSQRISDGFRVAFDIQQVARHALHTLRYYRDPGYRQNCGAYVYGDLPTRYSAYEPVMPVLLMRPLSRR